MFAASDFTQPLLGTGPWLGSPHPNLSLCGLLLREEPWAGGEGRFAPFNQVVQQQAFSVSRTWEWQPSRRERHLQLNMVGAVLSAGKRVKVRLMRKIRASCKLEGASPTL